MKFIEKFEKFVACASVSVMAILVFVNVIARFIFNSPLAVADEMSWLSVCTDEFHGNCHCSPQKSPSGTDDCNR